MLGEFACWLELSSIRLVSRILFGDHIGSESAVMKWIGDRASGEGDEAVAMWLLALGRGGCGDKTGSQGVGGLMTIQTSSDGVNNSFHLSDESEAAYHAS